MSNNKRARLITRKLYKQRKIDTVWFFTLTPCFYYKSVINFKKMLDKLHFNKQNK